MSLIDVQFLNVVEGNIHSHCGTNYMSLFLSELSTMMIYVSLDGFLASYQDFLKILLNQELPLYPFLLEDPGT